METKIIACKKRGFEIWGNTKLNPSDISLAEKLVYEIITAAQKMPKLRQAILGGKLNFGLFTPSIFFGELALVSQNVSRSQ